MPASSRPLLNGTVPAEGRSVPASLAVCVLLLAGVLALPAAAADGGMVHVDVRHADIDLYEPGQKALLCWDGERELMILSIDVYAEEPTTVVEIVPLPDVPEVGLCGPEIFEGMRHLLSDVPEKKDEGGMGWDPYATTGEGSDTGVDIIFHTELGIHSLTVVHAQNGEGFGRWVAAFLEEEGLSPGSYPEAEQMADVYISRGVRYFALDILELDDDVRSVTPVFFHFNSTELFFPMEVSRLTGGDSRVLLFTVTPHREPGDEYETRERHGLGFMTTTWQDIYSPAIEPPESPVDFELLNHRDVHKDELRRMMWEPSVLDRYDPGDPGVDDNVSEADRGYFEVLGFFPKMDRLQLCVFEYEGSLELEGDVVVRELGYQAVMVREDYETDLVMLGLIMFLPQAALVAALVVLMVRSRRRDHREEAPPAPPGPCGRGGR